MFRYIKRILFRLLLVVILLLMIVSFSGCKADTITQTVKIEELEWEAVAEIEERKPCNESGWEVPEGATVYKEQEEIKSHRVVGYKTKYRTEEYQEIVRYTPRSWRPIYETRTRFIPYKEAIEEPVFATKYYYTIEKWTHSKNLVVGKGYNDDYSYPEYACEENERIKGVEYTYLVKFKALDRDISYVVSKEKWEKLQVGQEILIEINGSGTIRIFWDNN